MGDPLNLKEKLKDPKHNNWLKAVYIMRELKDGISPFIEDRCREAQEAILQEVVKNLPSHVTKVPACTECTRVTLNNKKPCPEKVCRLILEEMKKIHKSGNIQLSCTDVSAWTNTSRYWEIAKTFMGKEYAEERSAADTDCSGLLSFIINCMPIHKYLITDMVTKPTVFHEVKEIRNKVLHSSDYLTSDARLQDLIKACVQILDDHKVLAADQTAIDAKERIKGIEGMLLTVSNVDYPSVFLEVTAYLEQRISDLDGKLTSEGNELRGRVGVLERCIEQLQTTPKDSMDQLGAEKLKEHILNGYQKDLSTVFETPSADGVSAIHMFSPIIIREGLENQFSDNSPVKQGTSAAASPISHHSGKVKHIESYRDIFFKDGQLQRTIILLGEAGVGKTTFCNHIVNLWCLVQAGDCQRDLTRYDQSLIGVLKQFEYLFIVRCRDTKDHISVLSMIKEMFCSEEDEKHIDNIFRYKTKQCLVIIDGLDEWLYTTSVGRGKNNLHVLPDCTKIHNATVIMTSRPWKVEALPRNSFLDYRVLQLEGLDWKSMYTLTQKCIEALEPSVTDHKTLCEKFVKQVEQQEMVDIVKQPLLLFSIIESWLSGNQTLHRSLTMNYAGLVNSVLSHSYTHLSDKDKELAESQRKSHFQGVLQRCKHA